MFEDLIESNVVAVLGSLGCHRVRRNDDSHINNEPDEMDGNSEEGDVSSNDSHGSIFCANSADDAADISELSSNESDGEGVGALEGSSEYPREEKEASDFMERIETSSLRRHNRVNAASNKPSHSSNDVDNDWGTLRRDLLPNNGERK